jgi:hypothetical protein
VGTYAATDPNGKETKISVMEAPAVKPAPANESSTPVVNTIRDRLGDVRRAAIAAAIVSRVESTIMAAVARVTSGTNSHDSQAAPTYLDFMGP